MVYILVDVKKKKRQRRAMGMADASIKECFSVKRDTSVDSIHRRRHAEKLAAKLQSDVGEVKRVVPQFLKEFSAKKERRDGR